MATLYGALGTVTQVNGGKVGSNLQYGRRRAWTETFELDAAAIDDVLWIGEFSDSTIVLPQSSITFDALGAGTELDVAIISPGGVITTVVDGVDTSSAGVVRLDAAAYIDEVPALMLSNEAAPATLALIVKGAAATGTVKASFELSVE